MYTSKLLYTKRPITINPDLAITVGLNEAIVLQQVQYWCRHNEEDGRNYRDGHYWAYNSFPKWQEQFPWWCERTVKTIFSKLEKQGLLISANYNRLSLDRTKWYRINHEALDALIKSPSGNSCTMDRADIARPIPETNSENNGIKEIGNFSPCPADSPAENPRLVSVPIVEPSEDDISWFISWYFDRYLLHHGTQHPNIKSEQRIRVAKTLDAFLEANDLDVEALQEMADAFFENVDCDHNINLFATSGMLENRYYEAIY